MSGENDVGVVGVSRQGESDVGVTRVSLEDIVAVVTSLKFEL